jgi:eukaryotic-like serine/threonine-protein kinase
MTLQTGTRLGAYEIRGPLGAGGMGEVYRAWDARLGREVAVKVLPQSAATDPDRLRRFEQEARAAGALNHPNVLAVYDAGSHESLPYIVSELLEGETLRELIRAGGLVPRKAVEHAVQIARGLAAAHQRGIIHRDLKPENVFVTRDGQVKILDFGLAKLRHEAGSTPEGETATNVTQPGMVLGTVPYLSPEQVRGAPADARSDIFALGSVLYEMLARRRAFEGETSAEILTAILRAEPPELPTLDGRISAATDRVVRRCLEKRPEDRFAAAQDVAFALEAAGVTTGLVAHADAEAAGRRRWRAALPLLATLLLGLAAGAVLVASLRRPAGPPSYTRLTFRRGAILSARFARDGQTVVYSAAWDGQPAQVFTTRVGSGEARPLDLEGVVLAVSSRDEVAVKRGRFLGRRTTGRGDLGTLARVSLSGGAPRDLIEDVMAADWDPEGQDLAVVRRVDGEKQLEYPIGHVVYRGDVFGVRVLPGGGLATFEPRQLGQVGSWRFDLTLFDRAGRKTVLSPGWTEWPNLSWSEATREILFVASRGDGPGLRAVSLAGRERVVARLPGDFDQHDVDPRSRLLLERRTGVGGLLCLPPGETRERELSWLNAFTAGDLSADGRHILLTDYGSDQFGAESLYLRKTDGAPAVRLGDYRGLSLSPDGRWVLALPGGQDFSDHLLLVPTGAGETRELRHPALSRFWAAAWFPDGKRIAVVSFMERARQRLFVWDVEMSAAPRALSPEGPIEVPVVSPDGRAVVVAVPGTGPVRYAVDGGPSGPVRGGAARDQPLRWSRDGRWLFVSRTPDFQPNTTRVWIDRIDLATGQRQPWKELTPGDPAGAYTVGGVYLTPDGQSYVYSVVSSLGELYLAEGVR